MMTTTMMSTYGSVGIEFAASILLLGRPFCSSSCCSAVLLGSVIDSRLCNLFGFALIALPLVRWLLSVGSRFKCCHVQICIFLHTGCLQTLIFRKRHSERSSREKDSRVLTPITTQSIPKSICEKHEIEGYSFDSRLSQFLLSLSANGIKIRGESIVVNLVVNRVCFR